MLAYHGKKEIRELVANFIMSEGCGCCAGDSHELDESKLAKALDVPQYNDGSGYNFGLFKTKSGG